MRRVVLLGLALSCAWSPVSLAQSEGYLEAQGTFDWYSPASSFWERAMGAEATLIYWWTPEWGIAYSLGYSDWGVTDRTTAVSSEISQAWSGNVRYIPMGVSAVTRAGLPGTDRLFCTLEAGVHYFFECGSKLTLTETDHVPVGGGQTEDQTTAFDADCEDGIVGRLSGAIEWEWRTDATLFLRAGYQFDLQEGEASVDWIDLHKKLDLEGLFIQVGVGISF
jgi:hypothetical protein